MSLYGLSILPLLQSVDRSYFNENGSIGVRHVAFADDLAGAGNISCLLNWWLDVVSLSNPMKLCQKHLGAAVGLARQALHSLCTLGSGTTRLKFFILIYYKIMLSIFYYFEHSVILCTHYLIISKELVKI